MATLYWAVYPSADADPTASELVAGTRTPAFTATGTDTAPTVTTTPFTGATISGLAADTSYKLACVWNDGATSSNVVVSTAFTTTDNTIITVGADSVVVTGSAPTVTATDNQSVTVGAGSLVVTGSVPTVSLGDNVDITIAAGSLTVTGATPTVTASDNQEISIGAGALAVTGATPVVTASDNQSVSVGAGSLSVTGSAPIVTIGDAQVVAVPAAALSVQGYSPTVSVTSNVSVEIPAGTVEITSFVPAVGTSYLASVPAGSVEITGSVPTATASVKTVTCTLVDTNGNALPNLTDLSYAWFDEPDPANLTSVVTQGVTESTDGSGVIEVPVSGSSLTTGQTGLLVLRSSDGNSLGAYNLAIQ